MSKNTKEAAENPTNVSPKIVKLTEELSCDLNEVEWDNRARELADAHRNTEFLKDRKKSVVADLNSDIKVAELQETKLSNVVANNRETREVTVEIKYDYDTGMVTKTRLDTNVVISEREMDDNERQRQLELDADEFIGKRHEVFGEAHDDQGENKE